MNYLKIIVISILMVLIVASMIGLQVVSVFCNTFLEPDFYEKIGTEQEFYAQTRQLMFRLINKSLPNGREGMPYFEKALTESWLKNEIDDLIGQFLYFAKGQKKEPPIIPIYKLKEKVVQSIDEDKSLAEKQRMVQYWFDPLPDEVRLQDFISIQVISEINRQVVSIRRLLWIMAGMILILLGSMYLAVRDRITAILWILAAIMASGIQVVLIGLGVGWLLQHSSYFLEIYKAIVDFGIPSESAWGLIQAFKQGFSAPLIMSGIATAVASGIAIYVLPIRERSLTLVK